MDSKRIAIMQPYLFPYIGYFQLIKSVDLFIIYDDVTYIKQGWINRNRILVSGRDYHFSVPVTHISSFRRIKDTEIHKDLFPFWRSKFLKTIEQSYAKSPYYKQTKEIVTDVLFRPHTYISTLATDSIQTVCDYLNIDTLFKTSTCEYSNDHLSASDRVIDICLQEQANTYINAAGGRDLYHKNTFLDKGLQLSFLTPNLRTYHQFGKPFIPWLSIIDVLMFNSISDINHHLSNYELS